jgi:hypothetical protein
MWKSLSNKQKMIAIGVAILLVGALIFYVYKQGGKSKFRNAKMPRTYGTADAIPTQNGNLYDHTPLANELHEVMDSMFTLPSTKNATWAKFINLPNDPTKTLVANRFNEMYGKDESLAEWVRNEYVSIGSSNEQATMLSELSRLQIS